MSGIKYMFDTNALIGFFNKTASLGQFILQEQKALVSVISVIEFLSFKRLTQQEKDLFLEFCVLANIIDVSFENFELLSLITTIRINNKLKLPDAIIAASAILNNSILITNDQQFSNIPNLQILSF